MDQLLPGPVGALLGGGPAVADGGVHLLQGVKPDLLQDVGEHVLRGEHGDGEAQALDLPLKHGPAVLPFVPGDANLSAQTARRLLELQAWVAEQSAAGLAPQLGNADPMQETLTAGAARLEQVILKKY